MDEIIIVNESSGLEEPGDVSLFRNREAACSWLEPFDVANEEFRAITLEGMRLDIHTDGLTVWMSESGTHPPDKDVVRRLLQSTIKAVNEAGRGKPVPLDASDEDLIAGIGFTD